MKKNILCIFVAALALLAQAAPVSPSQARQAAAAWAARNGAFGERKVAPGRAVPFADEVTTLWYQVQMSDGSCLIVSPVTELEPVVAALENMDATKGLPEGHPMRTMLMRDMTDRLRKLDLYRPAGASGPSLLSAAPAGEEAAPSDPVMAAWAEQGRTKWEKLLPTGGGIRLMEAETNGVDDATMGANTIIRVVDGFEQGGRFTHWDQKWDDLGKNCYNYYTPSNYPCGCVATAMAALLQFFGANATKAELNGPHGPCTVDGILAPEYKTLNAGGLFDGYDYYDWSLVDEMTNRADYADSGKMTEDVRSNLLGRVTYDAGVMLSMGWAEDGSGTQTSYIADALPKFQKVVDLTTHFALGANAVSDPSPSSYAKLIYNQCRAGAPVALGITQEEVPAGHAVLAVGYGRDDEGNERVRIFTGWGGTGDGWYALPYINTKSLPQDAGKFLFDVVHTVITMIGYENEGTVPVVGRIVGADVANKTFQLQIREGDSKLAVTNLTTDANGYFGVRIRPNAEAYWLERLDTGEAVMFSVSTKIDIDDLSTLPSEIQFPYFCDMAAAGQFARASGKPIFCLSGTEGGAANLVSTNANVDSRFVRVWISDATAGDFDGNPSFGVFNPLKYKQGGGWRWENGRLSYSYGFSKVWRYTTNDYDEASTDEDAYATYEYVTNEAYVASCGCTNTMTYMTTDFPHTEEGLLQALGVVLDGGWAEYQRQTHGIALTVTGTAAIGAPDPAFGVHTCIYTNGQTVTATAPATQVTNAEEVVMSFGGWTLTNETTGAFQTGTGTTAVFPVSSNDVLILTWQMTTNQVWISIEDRDDEGVTRPGTGWYPYGQVVTFTATPNDGGGFDQWQWMNPRPGGGRWPTSIGEGRQRSATLSFVATEPLALLACYGGASVETIPLVYYPVRFVSIDTNWTALADAALPAVSVLGTSVAMGNTKTLPNVQLSMRVQATVFTDSLGKTWQCVGWALLPDGTRSSQAPASGSSAVANFELTGAAVLEWIWIQLEESASGRRALVEPADVPAGTGGAASPPISIALQADGKKTLSVAVGNAVAGYWYTVVTATDLAGPFTVLRDATTGKAVCCKYAAADGPLDLGSVTIDPSDERRFYKVRICEEDPDGE